LLPDSVGDRVLAFCRRGELSAPVALARLLAATPDAEQVRAWLRGSCQDPTARMLAELLEAHAGGVARTAAVLRVAEGASEATGLEDGLAACSRLFDAAVACSPEAAVAAYSLGDPALLAEATVEIAALLKQLGVLGPTRQLLDLGCGIGRLELALSGRVGAITGVDLSPGMIREARVRCAHLPNVALRQTSGWDLAPFPDRRFDAVIAVDSVPYLYQAGGPKLVLVLLGEAARVLRSGGDLVVLNLSYRGDLERDRADAAAFADALGLKLLRNGSTDLDLWDGRTFHFRRP
jgi:predicted TPR repeat methyltransferase